MMSASRRPALFLTTAIMLAIVAGFIVYSSSALGDPLDDLFDQIVREEDTALIRERLHTYQRRCKVRVAMNGVGFPVILRTIRCEGVL